MYRLSSSRSWMLRALGRRSFCIYTARKTHLHTPKLRQMSTRTQSPLRYNPPPISNKDTHGYLSVCPTLMNHNTLECPYVHPNTRTIDEAGPLIDSYASERKYAEIVKIAYELKQSELRDLSKERMYYILRACDVSHAPGLAWELYRTGYVSQHSHHLVMNALQTAGLVEDAQHIYSSSRYPTMRMHEAVLRHLCASDDLRDARGHFKHMQRAPRKNIKVRQFNIMLQAYNEHGNMQAAMQLFNDMVRYAVERVSLTRSENYKGLRFVPPDVTTYNIMIRGSLAKGQLVHARKYYDTMIKYDVKPDIITYDMMIAAYVEDGNMAEARALTESMDELDIKPDIRILSTLLKGYCKAGDVEHVDELSAHFTPAPGAKLKPMLCSLYAKQQSKEYQAKALTLFEEIMMFVPSVVALLGSQDAVNDFCTSLVADLTTCLTDIEIISLNDITTEEQQLDVMNESILTPDMHILQWFNIFLKMDRPVEAHVMYGYLSNTMDETIEQGMISDLLSAYCRYIPLSTTSHETAVTMINTVVALLNALHVRTKEMVMSVISAYCHIGDLVEATTLFEHVEEPSLDDVNLIIAAYCKTGDILWVERAQQLVNDMEGNHDSYSALLRGYVLCNNMVAAELILSEIANPSVSDYSVLLQAFADQKDVPRAMRLIEQLKEPALVHYEALVQACCNAGAMSDAEEALEQYILPEVRSGKHYEMILKGYWTLGDRLLDAQTFFNSIPLDMRTDRCYRLLLTMLCQAGEISQAAYVLGLYEEQVLELEKWPLTQRHTHATMMYEELLSSYCREGKMGHAQAMYERLQRPHLRAHFIMMNGIYKDAVRTLKS